MRRTRVTIVGAGFVGSTSAYAIALKNLVDEIFLVDVNEDKVKSEALDLGQSSAILGDTIVKSSSYEEARDSDIVIITAGVQPKFGETRLAVLGKNIGMYKGIVEEVCKYNKEAILIVVGNPVDILTYYTYKLSGFPRERVLSSGTIIDSNRLRYFIANYLNVKYTNVEGIVLGEHGDSQVVIWDSVKVHGVKVEEYCKKYNIEFTENIKKKFQDRIKKTGFDIVFGKGYTNFGIAEAVARAVKAIVRDEHILLPIGIPYEGEFGINNVHMSAPAIVTRDGFKEILKLNLSKDQLEGMKASSETLKKLIKEFC